MDREAISNFYETSKHFSASSPAPPFQSKESRDYLDQVPPNLYEDSSYTVHDVGSSSQRAAIIIIPSTSNCIQPALSDLDNSKANDVCNDSKSKTDRNTKINEGTNTPDGTETLINADTANMSNSELDEAKPVSTDMSTSQAPEPEPSSHLTDDQKEHMTTDVRNSISPPATENQINCDTVSHTQNDMETELIVEPGTESGSHDIADEEQVNSIPEELEKQTASSQALGKEDTDMQGFPKATADEAIPPPNPEATAQSVDNMEEKLQESEQTYTATCSEESSLTPVG